MSYKQLKKKTDGFTIIEVLIVLAIAGLIMLIVFLAVPALQRNSRNTQRKNDVAAVIGGIQEYANNNNGKLGPLATMLNNAKLGFYDTAEVTGNTERAVVLTTVTPDLTGVQVNNFSKCPATVPASGAVTVNAGATKRSVTAVYQVETTSSTQNICQDL